MEKSVAFWVGPRSPSSSLPVLPGGIQWSSEGFKYLGLFLGIEAYEQKNWENFLEKIKLKLARWRRLYQLLSLKTRVSIINNLVVPFIWQRVIPLEPLRHLVTGIQRVLTDFFLVGHHWLGPDMVCRPRNAGGQNLMHIPNRIMAFRISTIKRLL